MPFLVNRGHQVVVFLHHFGQLEKQSEVARRFESLGAIVNEKVKPEMLDEAVESVLEFLEDNKPQVFLPQCLIEGFIAGSIAGLNGLPWIATLHSDDPDYWEAMDAVRLIGGFSNVVSVSKHISLGVSNRYGIDSEIIRYGVPEPEAFAKWSNSSFTVVFCGRVIEQQKRITLVIQSMIEACWLNKAISCKIVGEGPQLDLAKQLVRTAGLFHRIQFVGRLAPDEVGRELLSVQSILLMSDYEGLPVALIEAMARGVVPVARSIPSGIPELIVSEVSGLMVDHSPMSAAKAIHQLANSRQLWEECSANARKVYEASFRESDCFKSWLTLIGRIAIDSQAATKINFAEGKSLPFRLQLKYCDVFRRANLAAKVYWCLAFLPVSVVKRFLRSRIVVRGPHKILRLLKAFK